MGLNLSTMYPSKYLKAEDCPRPRTFTIESVVMELVGQTKDNKPIVYFSGEDKGLVLNKTCATQVAEVAQNDDTDFWVGVVVELYVDNNVFYQGKRTPGIRVRTPRTAPAALQGGQPRQPAQVNSSGQQMAPADAVTDDAIPDPGDPMTARQQARARQQNTPF